MQTTIDGDSANINTEGAFTQEINGGFYVYNERTKSRMFFISDGEYEYAFIANESIPKEKLFEIAESIG